MRCDDFRQHHCAFVDDTLAGVEIECMRRHLEECPACADLDARVRRSLMVARSIPHIEPSEDFAKRLEARLRACREHNDTSLCANFRMVASWGAVASLCMLAYMAESLPRPTPQTPPRDIVLPPVIAMAEPPAPPSPPDNLPSSASAPAILASVSAGIPLWPAALFAEQAPLHFASYRQIH